MTTLNRTQIESSYTRDIFDQNDVFTPFLEQVIVKFENKIKEEINSLPSFHIDEDSVLQSILKSYKKKIKEVSDKTIIFEFHETFEELDPQNNRKYYDAFSKDLQDKSFMNSLFHKYPVLHTNINQIERQYLHNCLAILKRFQSDYMELEDNHENTIGKLLSISMDLGDTHCGGNTVAKLECEHTVLMYKPRSLQADKLYEEITSFFNKKSTVGIQTVNTLDKGSYGWQSYVPHLDLQTKKDGHLYYKRLGMQLAFIYMFHGSDFHYENIIAHESSPVIIDLETLFQPSMNLEGTGSKTKHLIDRINETVYKSLFLSHSTSPEDTDMNNYYGLSNVEGQQYPEERILHEGTDEICVKTQTAEMDKGTNLPVFQDEVQNIFGYEVDFLEGFEEVYLFFLQYQEEITDILEDFPNFPLRLVMRPTYVYTNYLKALRHPKYQVSFQERDRVLSFLKDSYTSFKAFQGLIPHELEDLQNQDVPYFYTYFKSYEVFNSQGDIINQNIIENSPMQEVMDRIHSLSLEGLRYQIQLINMSLTSSFNNTDAPSTSFETNHKYSIPHSYENIIEKETEAIWRERLEANDMIQWLSLSANPNGNIVAGPISFGFYDGLAGIAYYLAAYSKQYQADKYHSAVKQCTETLHQMLPNSILKNNLSAYYGISSYAYYMEKLYEMGMTTEEEIRNNHTKYIKTVQSQLIDTHTNDFIGGLAGTLKVLTTLCKNHQTPELVETAHYVYSQLKARIIVNEDETMYWLSDSFPNTVLAGFSHGLTGICYALSEYATIVDNPIRREIADIITKTLAYEDKLYEPEEKNWQDNRSNDKAFSAPLWCHGAAGILLGRVKIHENIGDLCTVNHIEDALSTTLKQGYNNQQGNSLCHGILGNIDILLEVSQKPSLKAHREEIEQTIETWVHQFWESMIRQGWHSGIRGDYSSVGFMLGKTGQLYTLLRLNNPSLPSVLLLD
ncbi:type 2 lanthipeptide synthetase LanM [Pontibacillus salicampi]|uniref:Type 2 lanthipeptide synthetase LanM n=1 Tax=Pontibacillus salicampi TaxID=1449801 RepID=A0ABV6LMH1_9BACI